MLVPNEFASGEDRWQREPAHGETPERIFERRGALSVLDRVVERLRNEFVQQGRPEHFEWLKVFLLGQSGCRAGGKLAEASVVHAIYRDPTNDYRRALTTQ